MKRHPTDPLSFAFGLLFATAGSLLLANRLDLLSQARWLVPLLLIVVALVMFASATWSLTRRGDGGGDSSHI